MTEEATHAESPRPAGRFPSATYRLQFHKEFTLRDAISLVPYLSSLGVSHLYASPLLAAMPGSTHGYDVCDPTCINPEIGTEEDLAELIGELHRRGMGLVLDIVPNHMGIGGRHNPWWWDVLKHGRSSRFARVFDIDWDAPGCDGKILLPFLGETYQESIASGALRAETAGDGFVLRYHEHEFPLVAESLPSDAEELDVVLQRQHYRLLHWRSGDSELNYRRFFTITSLAGVRVEDPEVFLLTHELLLRWHERGWIDGFRIDHPDGLRDPKAYLENLRRHAPRAWITVEKILTGEEVLPEDWPVDGTTGYDFLNRAMHVLCDLDGMAPLTNSYHQFTGVPADFTAIAREAEREVLRELLAAEVSRLLRLLPVGRVPLIEFLACFPIYRTYVTGVVSDHDRKMIDETAKTAKANVDAGEIDLIRRALLGGNQEFTARFQQLSGPAMAKGLEDRSFYRFHRLPALNEVGGDPDDFEGAVERFHRHCSGVAKRTPGSMSATATHDTKRGEDVRARLCLLSEIPERWAAKAREWSVMNERHRQGYLPDRNAEYLFYQTVAGAWPLDADRAAAYMEKAAREAAQHTSWTDPDAAYEAALRDFVTACLGDDRFTNSVREFVAPLLDAALTNSLAQTLWKIAAPGIPDIYQGTELWDLSLVDPDNRRPVDFAARREALAFVETASPEAVWRRRDEGLPKLWLIRRGLEARKDRETIFACGAHQPLAARGAKAGHALAFTRGGGVLALATRLPLRLGGDWQDTSLRLPDGAWRNALTGDSVSGGEHLLRDLLERFPVVLFVRE